MYTWLQWKRVEQVARNAFLQSSTYKLTKINKHIISQNHVNYLCWCNQSIITNQASQTKTWGRTKKIEQFGSGEDCLRAQQSPPWLRPEPLPPLSVTEIRGNSVKRTNIKCKYMGTEKLTHILHNSVNTVILDRFGATQHFLKSLPWQSENGTAKYYVT